MKKDRQRKQKIITFVDLFAGIGGFHLGVKGAAKKLGFRAECLLAIDVNEKARATYKKNFKRTWLLNDVTDSGVKNMVPKNVDIICGGFPCQPFSLAGKKRGVDDDRGTLFRHIVEILKDKTPKAVFLENVRNLVNIKNSDGRKMINVIKDELERAGYPIAIEFFKATDFGLPTYRPRIYMVGFRKDILSDLNNFSWPAKPYGPAPTLAEYFSGLGKKWDGLVARNGWPDCVGNTLRVGGAGSGFRDGNTRRDRRNWDSYMFKNGTIHKITKDEAKAMMGFPPKFYFPVPDLQAMKQLGNSVAVPVIQAIASEIIKVLDNCE